MAVFATVLVLPLASAEVRADDAVDASIAQLRKAVVSRSDGSHLEDRADTAIQVGQVPEPSTGALAGLGLLACGMAGVRQWRRSRRTAHRRST